MKIRGKQAICFDIKVFKNLFACTFYDTESEYKEQYEVSERKNQMQDIIGIFLCPDYIFVGYNSIHYSIPILNFIIENQRTMPFDYKNICSSLYELSQTIITSENFSDWSKWKHTKHFLTVDLYTMLAASKDRIGLKEAQITSGYEYVTEFRVPYDEEIEEKDIDDLLKYSENEAKSLKHILNKLRPEIELREQLSDEYNLNLMSKDNVSMGLEIVKKKYLERTGQEWGEIKDRMTPVEVMKIGDAIPKFIEFNSPTIKKVVSEIQGLTINVNDKKPFEKRFLLDDMEMSMGMGGLHSIVDCDEIIPKDNEELLYVDVHSMYPSIILQYKIVPPHINANAFLYIFKEIWDERIKADNSCNLTKSMGLKHAMNSIIGNYRVYTSWLYSPTTAATVNIMGQIFILKLAEMLLSIGASIKQVNTDGIIFTVDKSRDYQKVLTEWEGLTCLQLNISSFKKMFQYDVNNYLAIYEDWCTAEKGIFSTEQKIGKGMRPKAIATAVVRHFACGEDPEDVIRRITDINYFLTYQKVDKKYRVEYDGEIIQRINRYYASTHGAYLYKCIVDEKKHNAVIVHFKDGTYLRVPREQIEFGGPYYDNPSVSHFEYYSGTVKTYDKRDGYENLMKASGVTLANDLRKFKTLPSDINYTYYIAEAKSIIEKIENRQLSLF